MLRGVLAMVVLLAGSSVAQKTGTASRASSAAQDEAKEHAEKVQAMCRQLREGNAEQRGTAANRLGHLGAVHAIPDLRKALADADAQVRYFALGALSDLGATDAVADIRPFLKAREPNLRIVAAQALLVLGDRENLAEIVKLAEARSLYLRRRAVELFAFCPIEEARPVLERCLQHEDKHVRCWAASALGGIRDPASVTQLEKLLRTEQKEGGDDGVRRACLEALANIDPKPYVRELGRALNDDGPFGTIAAVEGLTRLRAPEARAALLAREPHNPKLNRYIMPEAIEKKLEDTSFPLREVRWLSLAEIAKRIVAKTSVPVKFSQELDLDPRRLHLGPSAILLTHKPNAIALLSSLSSYLWEGLAMNQSLSWVYDEGTLRVVTAAEAARFFRRRLGKE